MSNAWSSASCGEGNDSNIDTTTKTSTFTFSGHFQLISKEEEALLPVQLFISQKVDQHLETSLPEDIFEKALRPWRRNTLEQHPWTLKPAIWRRDPWQWPLALEVARTLNLAMGSPCYNHSNKRERQQRLRIAGAQSSLSSSPRGGGSRAALMSSRGSPALLSLTRNRGLGGNGRNESHSSKLGHDIKCRLKWKMKNSISAPFRPCRTEYAKH